tara:strand:+ start:339 stop:2828 length:2490 start_codon:yes stop_codon:yes gene_type:complete
MDLFYQAFLFPIEWLMRVILEAFYILTDNYGLSIILLSILINIFIIPFDYVADFLGIQHKKKLEIIKPKIDLIKKEFTGQERHLYLQTLYRVNNYHPLSNLKGSVGLLFQIPFFFAAFHLLGNYESFNNNSFFIIKDLGKPDGLFFGANFLPFLMTLVSLLSSYIFSINKSNSEKFPLIVLSIFFLIILYFESSALLIYWTVSNIFSLIKNWVEEKIQFNFVRHTILNFLSSIKKTLKRNTKLKFIINNIYCQASILFFGLIFVYKAIPIAASDVGMYGANYQFVVLNLILFFLTSIVIAMTLYYFLGNKWRDIAMKLLTFGALVGLFFSFVMPFEINKINALSIPLFSVYESVTIKVLKLFALFPLLLIWFVIFKTIKKIIWFILLFLNIMLMSHTLSAGLSPTSFDIVASNKSGDMSINQANEFYAFSKDSNTIVIMLDMFQGNIFADIIDEHPELIQQFSGFTYYPNTLSHGSSTWKSISAIAGGQDFQVQYMNEKIQSPKLPEIDDEFIFNPKERAYLKNMKMAQLYNHDYSIFKPSYVNCDIFNSYQNSICSNNVIINKELLADKNLIFDTNSSFQAAIFFAKFSLVLNLPHQTKNIAGRLLGGNYFSAYMDNVNQYSQLQNLIDFTNPNSSNKTFKFFENKITHSLWMLNENCKIVNENFDYYRGLFNSGYCSLNQLNHFFTKLNTFGIYDNTKIIIVSDHGSSSTDYGYNYINSNNFNIQPSASSALMLVKDFNQSGNLRISNEFMSNMDAYGIALSGVSEGENIQLDTIMKPIKNRSLIYIHEISPDRSYNIIEAYKVTNDMFNKNNWERLNQNQIIQLSQ